MIIFGTRGKTVAGNNIKAVCPECGKDIQRIFGIKRYFYIFWIPFFPTSFKAGIECLHCKYTRIGKEIEPNLAKQIKKSIFTKRHVLPLFFGLFLFALLLLSMSVLIVHQKIMINNYLTAPQENDYYVIKTANLFEETDKNNPYGVLKILKIEPEGIKFAIGNYVYKSSVDATMAIVEKQVNNSDYFNSEPLFLETEYFEQVQNSGAITNIKRY